MPSIFNKSKDSTVSADSDPYQLIERETQHLKKKKRFGKSRFSFLSWLKTIAFLAFVFIGTLYLLDPFLYAYEKRQAMRAYLYLKNYGAEADLEKLSTCGLITSPETTVLDRKHTDVSSLFSSPADAEAAAQNAIHYQHYLNAVQAHRVESLSGLSLLRYNLFNRFGIIPPRKWNWLDPKAENVVGLFH